MTTYLVNAELIEQFNDEGYIILRNLVDHRTVRGAQTDLNHLVDQQAEKLKNAGVIVDVLADEPFETRLFRLYETCLDDAPDYWRSELHLAGLFDIFFNAGLLDIVESILGPEIRLYPNYTVRPKLPDHAQTLVLWHQDGGYTEHWHKTADGDVDEFRMVNVWSPLVPARVENGCMQFISGTHKLGLFPHEQREFYLEIPRKHLDPLADRMVDIELDPGDVVLFHNMLCHQGLPNRSNSIRWSMDWRYQDATQQTLREQNGHLARSHAQADRVVASAAQWESLSFC